MLKNSRYIFTNTIWVLKIDGFLATIISLSISSMYTIENRFSDKRDPRPTSSGDGHRRCPSGRGQVVRKQADRYVRETTEPDRRRREGLGQAVQATGKPHHRNGSRFDRFLVLRRRPGQRDDFGKKQYQSGQVMRKNNYNFFVFENYLDSK